MKKNQLLIKNLRVKAGQREILKGVDLEIKSGEIHVLMGSNGAGKTTLAQSLMGNPNFKIKDQRSKIKINGIDLFTKNTEERARAGLFVSFQETVAVPGVSFFSFLRTAYNSLYPEEKVGFSDFKERIKNALKKVSLSEDFLKRLLNTELSGGEKKKCEIVQILMLRPKFAILDEIDSGLDVDSLRLITQLIREIVFELCIGILFISHNPKIFHYIKPDFVHLLKNGRLRTTNNLELMKKIGENGYGSL